ELNRQDSVANVNGSIGSFKNRVRDSWQLVFAGGSLPARGRQQFNYNVIREFASWRLCERINRTQIQ
ncbi:MAG: hypothetical protein R6V16_05045, partial [Bacteroidales bacterium]